MEHVAIKIEQGSEMTESHFAPLLFRAKALTTPVFASFTGQTWSDFVAANAKAADLQIMTNRLMG